MSRPAMSAPLVRITLDPEQSRQLDQAGAGAFSIVARGSYPAARDRWILTLAPAERQTAVAACHVLLGTHRAARIKPTVRADRPGRLATPAANNFNPPMNATPAADPAHGCGHRSGNHPGAIVGKPRTIHGAGRHPAKRHGPAASNPPYLGKCLQFATWHTHRTKTGTDAPAIQRGQKFTERAEALRHVAPPDTRQPPAGSRSNHRPKFGGA